MQSPSEINDEINEGPGGGDQLSQLEPGPIANLLASSGNKTSSAWFLSKRSVFELLSQDAIRRQRKWR